MDYIQKKKGFKKEFEEKFGWYRDLYLTAKDAEKIYNDSFSFLESKIKQERDEVIKEIKKSLPSHSDGMISRNEVKKILDKLHSQSK